MNGSHVLWNLGSHREEKRGEACCVLSKVCSSARVPMVRGHDSRVFGSVGACRLERCAENTGMFLGECVCDHNVICVSQCLKSLLKKPPLTGTALHHALRLRCGVRWPWHVRLASPTCDVVVEGGLVGIWGLALLQQKESIPHTLHRTLTLYTRRRQYQPHPRRARPSLATTRAP